MLWQAWWVWMAAGVILGILEVLAPAFVLLGFAIGAVLVGLLMLIGVLGQSLPITLLVFAFASLISWIALRQLVGVRRGQIKIWDRDINEN